MNYISEQYILEELLKDIDIREIQLKDWKKILPELYAQFETDIEPTTIFKSNRQSLDKKIKSFNKLKSKTLTLVANYNGKDIGFIFGIIDPVRTHIGTVKMAFLNKQFRSQGIMDELFKKLTTWFKNNKAPVIRVWTAGQNNRDIAFYKKMEFDIDIVGLRNLDSKSIKI